MAAPTDGMAVASLVCGILGLVFLCAWGLGAVLSLVALILGIISRNRIKAPGAQVQGGGMALAGIITGAVGLVLGVLVVVFFIIALATSGSSGYYG